MFSGFPSHPRRADPTRRFVLRTPHHRAIGRVTAVFCAFLVGALAVLPTAATAASPSSSAPAAPADLSGVPADVQTAIRADLAAGVLQDVAPGRFAPYAAVSQGLAITAVLRTLVWAGALPNTDLEAVPTGWSNPYVLPPTSESGGLTAAALATATHFGLLAPWLPPPRLSATLPMSRAHLGVLTGLAAFAGEVPPAPATLSAAAPHVAHLSGPAAAALAWAVNLHLLTPAAAHRWDPNGPVTRATLALALYRLHGDVANALPVSVSSPDAALSLAQGTPQTVPVTLTTAAHTAVVTPFTAAYRFTVTSDPAGCTALATPGVLTLTAAHAGVYTVRAALQGGYLSQPLALAPLHVTVYGAPAQVVVAAPSSLVADGQDAAQATITVEDSGGRVVSDFSGVLSVASTNPGAVGVVAPNGQVATAPFTVTAHNGTAQVTIKAGFTPGDVVGIRATMRGGILGQADVATVAQVPTAIRVLPAAPAMPDRTGAEDALLTTVVDQAGFPMNTGRYPIELSIEGAAALKNRSGLPALFAGIGAGPIHLTYVGGSPAGAATALAATGRSSGTVVVQAQYTGSGPSIAPGQATIGVVGGAVAPTPPAEAVAQGLALSAASPGTSGNEPLPVPVAGGAILPVTLAYTGSGTAPIPAPSPLSITLSFASQDGGSIAFTNLPTGAQLGSGTGGGQTVTLTLPAGSTSIVLGVVGLTAGNVTLGAQATPPAGTASTAALTASLPLIVTSTAPAPSSVTWSASSTSSTSSAGPTVSPAPYPGGISVTLPAANTPVALTLTLTGTNGGPVVAPTMEALVLGDTGTVSVSGESAPADALTPGGSFTVGGVSGARVLLLPPGTEQVTLTYTNTTAGTYALSAELVNLPASGIPSQASPIVQGTTASYPVALVGLIPYAGPLPGNLAGALGLAAPGTGDTASHVTAVPASEASPAAGGSSGSTTGSGTGSSGTGSGASTGGGQGATSGSSSSSGAASSSSSTPGLYTVTGTWSPAVPTEADVVATLSGLMPDGTAATVPLGASAVTAPPPILTVSTENLTLPANQGSAVVGYAVKTANGTPVPGASIDVTLLPAQGAVLSLAASGTVLRTTLTTNAQGIADVTVYGHVVPSSGTLTATLTQEPGAVPVVTAITVTAGSARMLVAPPSELGPIRIPASPGWQRLVFEVTDAAGNPIAGVKVTFALAVGSTGLTLDHTAMTSTTDGLVDVLVYGDQIAAQGQVVASIAPTAGAQGEADTVVTGPITVSPGAPAQIVTGLPPGDSIGAAAAAQGVPLTIAVEDARGNPVTTPTPVTVTASGVLSVAGSGTVTTDAAGMAQVTLEDPQGTAGAASITLTGPDGIATTLPLSVTSGPPAHITVGPFDIGSVAAGSPVGLTITATDAYGNPVNGTYEVRLSGSLAEPSPGGDAAMTQGNAITFQDGQAVGPYEFAPVLAQASGTLTVSVGPLPGASAQVPGTLTVTPADPALVTAVSVQPTSGPAPALSPPPAPWTNHLTQTLAAPTPKTAYRITFQVTDAEGNPVAVSGLPVDVTLTDQAGEIAGQGATISAADLSTDAQGQAVLTYTSGAAVHPAPAVGDVLTATLPLTGAADTLTTGGY